MMTTSTRRWKLVRSRSRQLSLLLALVVLTGSVTLGVARPEPAAAFTVQVSATEMVITSERFSDIGVHATVILTLRSNGDMVLRLHNVHNTARTRKYVTAFADVTFAEAAFEVHMVNPRVPSGGERIGPDEQKSWEIVAFEPRLQQRWDRVLHGTGNASLRFEVARSRF